MLCALLMVAEDFSYDEHTGKLTVRGVLNTLKTAQFPLGLKNLCVVTRLMADASEVDSQLQLKADVLDESQNVVSTWSKQRTVPRASGKRKVFIDEFFSFEDAKISQPGSYQIVLSVNDQRLASCPLEIVNSGSILLIDDDLDLLSILAAMLSGLPYPVETALSGARALEMLQTQVPALVITDMVMPDVSGSEIIRAIRSNNRLKDTRIIITTSMLKYISDQDRQLADKIILKPPQKDELAQTVRELLGD